MSYSINTESAKKANNRGGYIKTNGDYLLKVELAEWVKGKDPKQSRAIKLHLVDANSQKASIDIWFQKADGSRNETSASVLDGIMTCMKLTNLSESVVDVGGAQVNMCPELEGKFIGMLIQAETDAYIKDGMTETIDKPTIYGVYQYKTNLTPAEILNGATSSVELGQMKSRLESEKQRFTKEYRRLIGSGGGQSNGSYGGQQQSGAPQLDDELPW